MHGCLLPDMSTIIHHQPHSLGFGFSGFLVSDGFQTRASSEQDTLSILYQGYGIQGLDTMGEHELHCFIQQVRIKVLTVHGYCPDLKTSHMK